MGTATSSAGSAGGTGDGAAPPGLPEIRDEAGDTPLWLPALGAALLAAVGLFLIFRAAFADAEAELADGPPSLVAPATEP